MHSTLKQFSESYNQENGIWGEQVSENGTKIVSVAFKETISETALKSLPTKITLPESCKFVQKKIVNPVVFVFVSPSIRSTDIELQELQSSNIKNDWLFYKTSLLTLQHNENK